MPKDMLNNAFSTKIVSGWFSNFKSGFYVDFEYGFRGWFLIDELFSLWSLFFDITLDFLLESDK